MSTSFHNLTETELKNKRGSLQYYIDNIDRELEKRQLTKPISQRIEEEIEDLEKNNTNFLTKIFKKIIKKDNSKKKNNVNKEKSNNVIRKNSNNIVKKKTIIKKKTIVKKKTKVRKIKKSENSKKKSPITIKTMKLVLNKNKISYKSSMKKDDLLNLIKKHCLIRICENLTKKD